MFLLGKVPPGYGKWDAERQEDEGGTQGSLVPGKDDKRYTFEIDKARIIHSPSLRRLQGKTQVLGVGERDFYRTCLTHSLEVAQIGRVLCREVRQPQEFQVDADLVETVCLAHDIVHPSFGHIGENCLHKKDVSARRIRSQSAEPENCHLYRK
jgi:dGTP triphosphohydrolase